MRRLYSFLILLFVVPLQILAKEQALTIYQARGLKKDNCYSEKASITCKLDQCTMNLFPMTQAQLSFSIFQIPKELRMAMGHFFEVDFKVKTHSGDQVEIFKWAVISIQKIEKDIQSSDGLPKKIKCSSVH